jgi:hypothetical protein
MHRDELNLELEPVPSERLKMLVGFYAPVLERLLKNIEDQSESYGDLIGKYVLLVGKADKEEQKKRVGFLLLQSGKIGEACEAMQQEVIQLSKDYI